MHTLTNLTFAAVIVLILSSVKGFILNSNELDPPTCVQGQFHCNNERCIGTLYVCDGNDDCGDLTDESPPYCNRRTPASSPTTNQPPASASCSSGYFQCPRGKCIPPALFCDGRDDCGDMTDESLPYCTSDDTTTPPASSTTNRPPALTSCRYGEFQCNNGGCIQASYVCDGEIDCADVTDESPPHCNYRTLIAS